MRAVATPGRRIWGLSGLVTAAALAVPGTLIITTVRLPWHAQQEQGTVTRLVTVPQPVTSLDVQSYGAPVRVTTEPVSRVRVTETLRYDKRAGGPPAVTQSVSGGHLTLADPSCPTSGCAVSFAVTVPPGLTVTVTTEGGPATVSGTAGATLDTGGGAVRATKIGGPLTVSTNSGPLLLNGLAGALRADTGGGSLIASGIAAATAAVTTGGGDARIVFSAAPDTLTVSTDGGAATLTVPGGPYALTADSAAARSRCGSPPTPSPTAPSRLPAAAGLCGSTPRPAPGSCAMTLRQSLLAGSLPRNAGRRPEPGAKRRSLMPGYNKGSASWPARSPG